jgi:uncharacterized coiled-coil DUF342 family protein
VAEGDLPRYDRRSGDETLAWRVGEAERNIERLRDRVHTMEATEAANRHLMSLITDNDKRLDMVERAANDSRATREAVQQLSDRKERGFSRTERGIAVIAGLIVLALQILQTFHTLH